MPKNPPLALWGAALFVSWNALLLFFLWGRPPSNAPPPQPPDPHLTAEVIRLAQDAESQLEQQKELLRQIQRWVPRRRQRPPKTPPDPPQIPPRHPHPPQHPLNPPQNPLNPPQNPLNPHQGPFAPPQNPLNPHQRPPYPNQDPLNPPQNPLNPHQGPFVPPQDPLNPPQNPFNPHQRPPYPNQDPLNPPQDPLNPPRDPLNPPQNPPRDPLHPPQGPPNPPQIPFAPPKATPQSHPLLHPPPPPLPSPTPAAPLPVLVLACDRSSVRRCLDSLLRYRPSAQRFPILVSQDCPHPETAAVISSYGAAVSRLRPPHGAEAPAVPEEHRKFVGYYRISRHYRWALGHVFGALRYGAAIVVEDDLEVAPDFYEYFQAVLPLLRSDRSLWCASAWHDNGKERLVDAERPELLYRTDFFPGLGWLLTAELWAELEPKWPPAFWDDWMRQPEQRRGRACVRPEVSRTVTFGRKGVSHGQFFDQHLRFMALNRRFVPFTRMDLSYLRRDAFDRRWAAQLRAATPVRLDQLDDGAPDPDPERHRHRDPQRHRDPRPEPEPEPESEPAALRLHYGGRDAFRAAAKALGLMDDLKAGVPRAAYRGVVTCLHRGRRVYLAPDDGWAGYDPSWG